MRKYRFSDEQLATPAMGEGWQGRQRRRRGASAPPGGRPRLDGGEPSQRSRLLAGGGGPAGHQTGEVGWLVNPPSQVRGYCPAPVVMGSCPTHGSAADLPDCLTACLRESNSIACLPSNDACVPFTDACLPSSDAGPVRNDSRLLRDVACQPAMVGVKTAGAQGTSAVVEKPLSKRSFADRPRKPEGGEGCPGSGL